MNKVYTKKLDNLFFIHLINFIFSHEKTYMCSLTKIYEKSYTKQHLLSDVTKLILVFNAASVQPQIMQLFPEHIIRHYQYLKDTIPDIVPQGLKVNYFRFSLCYIVSLSENHSLFI